MTNFQDLKDRPDAFVSLTRYTLEAFTELSPHFSYCFLEHMRTHTLDGKPRKRGINSKSSR